MPAPLNQMPVIVSIINDTRRNMHIDCIASSFEAPNFIVSNPNNPARKLSNNVKGTRPFISIEEMPVVPV